jgi:pyruvate dehydrogenase E1 component
LLESDFGISANLWSATSFNELRRDGLECERWNLLHPEAKPRTSWVSNQLGGKTPLPTIAATDYMKAYADQIREFVPGRYRVLGTDGFGRSDTREQLREFFEVNRHFVVIAALKTLAETGKIPASKVSEAITRYGINPEKPNPVQV